MFAAMSDTPATPEETPAEEYPTTPETTEAEAPESGEAEAAPESGNKGWDGTPPGLNAEDDDAEAADDPE